MVEIVYQEIACPDCRGEGWLHGAPHPRQPALCELLQCVLCGGAGALRQAAIVRVEERPPPAEQRPLAA
jgi:hypothetical protein